MRYVLRSLEYDQEVHKRVAKPNPKLIGPAKKLYAKGEICTSSPDCVGLSTKVPATTRGLPTWMVKNAS